MNTYKIATVYTLLYAFIIFSASCSNEHTTESVNILPLCTISQPSNGDIFILGDIITVQVNAEDEDGQIDRVIFFTNNELQHTDDSSPFEFTWNTSENTYGNYVIRAEAIDNEQKSSVDSVAVTVFGERPILPDGIDPDMSARLTEHYESEHFIFHYEPGDEIWVERSEAYHNWAVDYLDVTPLRKINYYKFRTTDDMEAAIGTRINGRAYPSDYSLVTIYSWHNHECFHIYNSLFCAVPTIRLYEEGMVVAHEFDPLNNNWVSQWNRRDLEEPAVYSEMIKEYLEDDSLYPIVDILESDAFNGVDARLIAYTEAGMFVSYLIETFGLDKMKEVFCSVVYDDSRDIIMAKFEEVFGVGIEEVEAAWLEYIKGSL